MPRAGHVCAGQTLSSPAHARAPVAADRRTRLAVVSILVLFAGGIALARLHTWAEPLERDLTTYAVIGHNLLHGRSLYSDLWDHKPPAIHVSYAVSELVFGYGPAAIYALNLTTAILTMFAIYAAASCAGNWRAGLWAVAFWAILSGDLQLQANQPNTEAFMNACLAGGFAILIHCRAPGLMVGQALLTGMLFMAATAYKQVVAVAPALLCLAHVAHPPSGCGRRRATADAALICAVGVMGWLGIFTYFHVVGHSPNFVDAVFRFNRDYAGNPVRNLILQFQSPQRFLGPLLESAPALILFCVLGLAIRGKQDDRRWILWLAYAVGMDISIHAAGRSHDHYFQLWMPVIVIGGAWGLVSLAHLGRWMERRGLRAAGAFALASLLVVQVPSYLKPADEWCRLKYKPPEGDVFAVSPTVAHEIDRLLAPAETFYVWGAETSLYYYASSRDLPTGLLYNYPLFQGPLTRSLSQRALEDLERSKPALVATLREPLQPVPHDHPIEGWLRQNYHGWPDNRRGPYDLFVRSGSELEHRLAQNSKAQTP
jgi:hypothetical protein